MRKHLISQLAHVELLTPEPEKTEWFFKDLLGMHVSAREGQSVYLRGFGDLFHHSLKITESPEAGMGHAAWRADDADSLEMAVAAIEETGLGEGWIDDELGHGPAYRFRSPDGHRMEVLWDVEWFEAGPDLATPVVVRPQRYPLSGAPARRLDHLTLFASDVGAVRRFHTETLGFRCHERIMMPAQQLELGAWLAVSNLSHDTAILLDQAGARGRLNHVAFWMDTREEVMRAADIMIDYGIQVEAGPSRHGISEAFFLYVREPGGNRIEIYHGGYLNFAPDWGPIDWNVPGDNPAMAWGGDLPESMFAYGTPPVELPEQAEVEAVPVPAT